MEKQISRKLMVYIAASVDGFIAKPNDDLSFLSIVQQEGEDYGYGEFMKTVDTVIMGRKTFDWVYKEISGLPHPDKETYVITKTRKPDIGKTIFYNDNLKELVLRLKRQKGSNIFCDGGAEIVNALLKENLVDEIIVSIIPILVGTGTRLFMEARNEKKLNLVSAKSYESGLIQIHYKL
jgi:dihydrofolate reductase